MKKVLTLFIQFFRFPSTILLVIFFIYSLLFDQFIFPQSQSNLSNVTEEWVNHYGSGLAPSDDFAKDFTMDNSGNIYVAGGSGDTWAGSKFVIIKYSTSGERIWITDYAGGTIAAISVDQLSNVYATGTAGTVKYNSFGEVQWTAPEAGVAITADNNGASITGSFNNDFFTCKYSNSGMLQWSASYNGTANLSDNGYAVGMDISGNVFVTGRTISPGINQNYTTIKYNLVGQQEWIAHYDGTANDFDSPIDLLLDNEGNVIVTGLSTGQGSSYDYLTIKYNNAGQLQWTARYNGTGNSYDLPSALVLDKFNNIYITGQSAATGYDIVTIKYDQNGGERWIKRYDAGSSEYGIDITVDTLCNLYVTGLLNGDFGIIKYDSSGTEKWTANYNAGPDNTNDYVVGIEADRSGNAFITGYSEGFNIGTKVITIKYNTNGQQQWIDQYKGPGNSIDEPADLTVDNQGNVYVTGSSIYSNNWPDIATVKYNAQGNLQWLVRFDSADVWDNSTAIVVNPLGDVYVTGWNSSKTDLNVNYVTIKYDSFGTKLWARIYDGPSGGSDRAVDIALDNSGNVLVAGESQSTETYYDYLTIKYSPDGQMLWSSRYSQSGSYSEDIPAGITADDSGNVYVTGNIGTVKYDPDGAFKWFIPASGIKIVVRDTMVYLTTKKYANNSADYFTSKYNTSGELQWATQYNGPGINDYVVGIALDSTGNVYVTGSSGSDFSTVKYNSDGEQQWAVQFNGSDNNVDWPKGITVDRTGNCYVTGEVNGYFIGPNYYPGNIGTVKYNSDGIEEWRMIYEGDSNSAGVNLFVDTAFNVYVIGYSYPPSWSYWRVYTTIKYSQDPLPVEMKYFNVAVNKNQITLYWETVTETNNYGFEIETFYDKDTWHTIAFVKGHGTTVQPTKYSHLISVEHTGTYRFRLKQTDYNGQFKYSPEIEANVYSLGDFNLSQNYPNPFNPVTHFSYSIPYESRVRVSVFNPIGEEVARIVDSRQSPGTYFVNWDASAYPSGTYFYSITVGEYYMTKKMLLIR